ncbi:hypothetical protein COU54_04750 [Candidatus Pacearchaeota archaeon CG10_big_fil_rev_8_21_14_0_10_31_24]|nr:MAG: hypothetical protein COU54_04750 [Candidatus Pacearchaeota archaeon CG10_big_fil_rev_8_21_14_0_10_31_24]
MRFYNGAFLKREFGGIPIRTMKVPFSGLVSECGIYWVRKVDEAVIRGDYDMAMDLLRKEGCEFLENVRRISGEMGQPLNLDENEKENIVGNYIDSSVAEMNRRKNK